MDEREWFADVYRRYADMLFRLARRLLYGRANEAELCDLVQDVFLVLWQRRDQLKTHPNIGGWLTEAVKLRAGRRGAAITKQALRTAYSLDAHDDFLLGEDGDTPESRAALAVHVDAIRALLGDEDAELFLAYALRGESAREIAARTGLSRSCVSMRIYRLRRRLRAHPEIFYTIVLFALQFGTLRA